MKIVVDTSVIIAVITNERHKLELIKLTEDSELISPASLHWEVGNAFSAMFKRNKINLQEAVIAIQEYKKIPIQFLDVPLGKALKYSYDENLYAYDAYFLVCAKNLNAPILSLDSEMNKKARSIGIKVFEVHK